MTTTVPQHADPGSPRHSADPVMTITDPDGFAVEDVSRGMRARAVKAFAAAGSDRTHTPGIACWPPMWNYISH